MKKQGDKILLRAAWVAPICAPAIRNGGVVFDDGTILDVRKTQSLQETYPDARIIDRPGCTILPGLVNPHVHLELSGLARKPCPSSFVGWLWDLIGAVPGDESTQRFVTRSIAIGVEQCLRFGVTCVGDITANCSLTRPLLAGAPIRVVSFGEVRAMGQRRLLLEDRLAKAVDATHASDRLRIGVSPHAPYSVEEQGYRRCVEESIAREILLATHLAETQDEATFLANHGGPLRQLWDRLGAWDRKVPTFGGGPVRFAKSVGLLDHSTLLAHVNYCDDAEMKMIADGNASVVYCPRTHAYFGHPPHRWREMLARGINVAVGTDSCASSPDLNLVGDIRLLRALVPDLPVHRLWEMVTVRSARAILMEDRVGTLAAGKAADMVLFPAEGDDPLAEILDEGKSPTEVWIDGTPASKLANRFPCGSCYGR